MRIHRGQLSAAGAAVVAAAAVAFAAGTPWAFAFTEHEPGGVQARVESAEVVVVRSKGDDGGVKERPIIAGSGTAFRDCKDQDLCPQMLVVPSSERGIELGTIETVEERKAAENVRRVTLQTFAIGKYEVSVGEYEPAFRLALAASRNGVRPAGSSTSRPGETITTSGSAAT